MPEVPTGQPGITAAEPPCQKRGPIYPEGAVSATIGCQYIWDDGVSWAVFYKESNDGGPTGWVQRIQLS